MFWMHDDVNCEATKYFTINNKSQSSAFIVYQRPTKYIDGKSQLRADTNELIIKKDTIYLKPLESIEDTIIYKYIGVDYCECNYYDTNNYYLDIKIFFSDTLNSVYKLIPWQEYKQYEDRIILKDTLNLM